MAKQETERQNKKEQFTEKKTGGSNKIIALSGFLIVVAVAGWFLFGQGIGGGTNVVRAENGLVNIKVSDIDDGHAHYFKFATAKGDINFFVVKSVDGVIRAAFDACDVCYREKKGYRQEGDMMVCNNCGQQFRTDMVNEVKGGCNPAPLARKVSGGHLTIAQADIVKGAWYFGI